MGLFETLPHQQPFFNHLKWHLVCQRRDLTWRHNKKRQLGQLEDLIFSVSLVTHTPYFTAYIKASENYFKRSINTFIARLQG